MRRFGLAVVAVGAVFALAPAAWAQSVQPGEAITTDVGGCTLNFIYDGAGGPYVGTAAHCVRRVGSPVFLGQSGGERIGAVAFRGDPDAPGRDYAFVKIDSDDLGKVDPNMKGHPGIPTGVSHDYGTGDLMQFSGYGMGFDLTAVTREQRPGVLLLTDGVAHDILGPALFGDSGGPIADLSDGGTAFGIVTELGLTEYGPNLDFVLRDAAARGFPVSLRTAR